MDERPLCCFGPSIMQDAPAWPEVHRRRLEDCGPLVENEAQRVTEANRQRGSSHHARTTLPRTTLPRTCRPATQPRRARRIEFRGESLTIEGWARRLGIGRDTMRYRLRHWPLEVALTRPRQRLS